MEQNLDILRQEIVDKSLEAFREGLFSGTSGNMSCRVAPDEMLITPTSVRYDVLRAQDIVYMKLDGTVLEGELQPSSEWRMHAAVYKAYGETNAVFHTHSPYATAFAVVRKSANHGVLAVGKDLAQAYLRAEYIEDVAKVYTFSKVLGTPVELASL